MLLKNCKTFKSLISCPLSQFSASTGPKDTQVMQTKHNPDKKKQLRGFQQNQLFMTQYEKSYVYHHKKTSNLLALYNIFSYLPLGLVKRIAKTVQDPKVQIACDQIHLPRISENSIPVFDSISMIPVTFKYINTLTSAFPFIAIAIANMPFVALGSLVLHYFLHFKSTYGKMTERMVIKMELLPQTQEIVYQKISKIGCITTHKARINDLQFVQEGEDLMFQRSVRNFVNLNFKFKIKSTGQILMFEKEGIWHEEGLKHELLI